MVQCVNADTKKQKVGSQGWLIYFVALKKGSKGTQKLVNELFKTKWAGSRARAGEKEVEEALLKQQNLNQK